MSRLSVARYGRLAKNVTGASTLGVLRPNHPPGCVGRGQSPLGIRRPGCLSIPSRGRVAWIQLRITRCPGQANRGVRPWMWPPNPAASVPDLLIWSFTGSQGGVMMSWQ